MKRKVLLFTAALFCAITIHAQDSVKKDTVWEFGGQFMFTVSQASFSDWAAGGENSRSGSGRIGTFANYVKNNVAWENSLVLAYGIAKQGDQNKRKSDDQIELNSKFGYKASKKWNYAIDFNAKTQFDDGYTYSDVDSIPDTKVSEFMAPFYLNLALGADYKPNKNTSVFLSPLNAKVTYVKNDDYAARFSIDSGKTVNSSLGAIAKFKFEKELIKNVNFLTKLDVFADYKDLNGLDDIDYNWEVVVSMKVYKLLSINFNTHLIWDKDVQFENPDGTLESRLQFKEIFGAGLAYKF